jgi:hypothetical protein
VKGNHPDISPVYRGGGRYCWKNKTENRKKCPKEEIVESNKKKRDNIMKLL